MTEDVDLVTRLGQRAYSAYDALVRRLAGRYYDPHLSKGLALVGGLPTLPGLGVVESAVVVLLGIAGLSAASS